MLDRRLVTDVALAAAIVLPAALPPTATPRSADSHILRPAPAPALTGLYASNAIPTQRQS